MTKAEYERENVKLVREYEEARVDAEQALLDRLNLQDTYDDLLSGFKIWKRWKVSSGQWTGEDEMLARWIERS